MADDQKMDLMKMLALRAMMEKEKERAAEPEDDGNDDAPSDKTHKKSGVELISLEEASLRLATSNSGRMQREIIASVIDPEKGVRAPADKFFNFSNAVDDISAALAFEVCRYALTIYPNNVDLLANAINFATDSGRFSEAEPYIERLFRIPRKYWNWRDYLFLTKYYENRAYSCGIEEMDGCLDKAFEVADAYIAALPLDERAYNKKAELHLMRGEVAEARDCLEKAIFGSVEVDGVRAKLVAQQCCGTYLGKILSETGEYKEIIRVALEAIKNTAQDQPSFKVGYAAFMLALAKDALIVEDEYSNRDKILEALADYQCAYDLNAGRPYAKTIEERYAILCQKAKPAVTDRPLLKRALYREVGKTEE